MGDVLQKYILDSLDFIYDILFTQSIFVYNGIRDWLNSVHIQRIKLLFNSRNPNLGSIMVLTPYPP